MYGTAQSRLDLTTILGNVGKSLRRLIKNSAYYLDVSYYSTREAIGNNTVKAKRAVNSKLGRPQISPSKIRMELERIIKSRFGNKYIILGESIFSRGNFVGKVNYNDRAASIDYNHEYSALPPVLRQAGFTVQTTYHK